MKRKKGIRQKLTRLILWIIVVALIVEAACSFAFMQNMREKALKTASDDVFERVSSLAQDRAVLADSMLRVAQNQTLLVADGAQKILENADTYLLGYTEKNMPDLICASEERHLVNVAVPENLLKNITKNENDAVTYAELNREAPTGGNLSVNEQLYLSSLLSNEFSQIYRFRTEGTEDEYKGFAASYFCFDDSGIDVLGDPKASGALICYDGRTRGWYKGAVEGYANGTLTKSGVFWTEPMPDGDGRGTSMACSAPVVVNGKVVGVAGSGGLINDFADLVKSSTLGSTGYSFMVSRTTAKVIINPNDSATESKESEVMLETDLSQSQNPALAELAGKIRSGESGEIGKINIDGVECYLAYTPLANNDWTMVTLISLNDDLIMQSYQALNKQIQTAFISFAVLIIVLILAAILISGVFSKTFTKPIVNLTNDVAKIGDGELEYKANIHTGDEIESLSHSFENMTQSLQTYIHDLTEVTAEKERIGAELDVATHIQASMLPCIFPPYPDREEFDIYATMNPAKEVGGDFYDFFMVDDTHIAIVMADVSGKGVPAALFMVIAKTLIKDHSTPSLELGEVFSTVNELLCESNSGELFVTAFEGVLDLVTGEFRYVNAGHEMPFICKKDGQYVPYKIKPGFVLAGMEGMKYKAGSMQLEPGDKVFQYTDGVTEATNKDNQLYGMDRLEKILCANADKTPDQLLPAVKADIDAFVGEAPQFDDITMLCLEYKKRGEAK